jgi:hypothetical protein
MKAHTKTSNQTYHSTNVRKTLDTAGRDAFPRYGHSDYFVCAAVRQENCVVEIGRRRHGQPAR